jgi:hypothetical protein
MILRRRQKDQTLVRISTQQGLDEQLIRAGPGAAFEFPEEITLQLSPLSPN